MGSLYPQNLNPEQVTKSKSIEDMKLTLEHLTDGQSNRGGWLKAQLELIGVEWPPKKGWKRAVIGSDLPPKTIEAFISMKRD